MLYNLIKSITSKSEDAKSILESIIEERIQEQLDFKRIEIGAMMMEDMDANGVIQLSPQQKRAQKAKKDHSDAVADQDDKDGNGAESDDDSDDSSDNKQPPQFQKKDDSSDDEEDDSDKDDDEEESGDIADKDPKSKKKNPFVKESLDESNVKTSKYSWGTMKTVQHGHDFSIPLHPEMHQAISKLNDGESHFFKDETKTQWTATRKGNDIHFKSPHGKTLASIDDLKEAFAAIKKR